MTATAAVRVHREGISCLVTLVGEIDLAVAPEVIELGRAMIETTDASDVVIDMARVTFLDSSGLGALVTLRNATLARGLAIRVANVPPQVRRVFDITGLNAVFDVAEDDALR